LFAIQHGGAAGDLLEPLNGDRASLDTKGTFFSSIHVNEIEQMISFQCELYEVRAAEQLQAPYWAGLCSHNGGSQPTNLGQQSEHERGCNSCPVQRDHGSLISVVT
jgi:hypothetical protein